MSGEPHLPEWSEGLAGLDEEAAGEHARAHGGVVRVIERDGQPLAVADGRVTAVHSRG